MPNNLVILLYLHILTLISTEEMKVLKGLNGQKLKAAKRLRCYLIVNN